MSINKKSLENLKPFNKGEGRQPLSEEEKRNAVIHIRTTAANKEALQKRALEAGFNSLTAYLLDGK